MTVNLRTFLLLTGWVGVRAVEDLNTKPAWPDCAIFHLLLKPNCNCLEIQSNPKIVTFLATFCKFKFLLFNLNKNADSKHGLLDVLFGYTNGLA
jgi:hypothetical protein